MAAFSKTRWMTVALSGSICALGGVLLTAATDLPKDQRETIKPQQQWVAEGRALFQKVFKISEGFGYRLGHPEVVLVDRQLGPDAKTCLECHNQGGFGGGAGDRHNVFVGVDADRERRVWRGNERNSTAVWGVGLVQALAQEMSADLQSQRKQAIAQAKQTGKAVTITLASKGVSFGTLRITENGDVDSSGVEGVDAGLVVKPFHAKGVRETVRRFTIEALWRHGGLESPELLKRRHPLQGNWEDYDHDGDGVVNEVKTSEVTALSVFQAALPMPQMLEPEGVAEKAQVRQGEAFFNANCATCHIAGLTLNKPEVNIEGAMGQPPVILNLISAGVLKKQPSGKYIIPLYSDLKRHNMGEGLAEKNGQLSDDKVTGVEPSWFTTTKLWGVADTAPYLHDGRAKTLEAAIIAHGGEAEAAGRAFTKLSDAEKQNVTVFLKCLKAPQPQETNYIKASKRP
jgi:hypothetical protein